ncbi:MAG: chloramphenicol acetyltransferase [Idiomarina sp.]|nr:chloramphenicol acetyltransferase [Idiomarina sp.]
MKQKIHLASWPRRQHFEFFNAFEEPFFGITTNLRCTGLRQQAKSHGQSFYLLYLHSILTEVNQHDALRMRIEGADVMQYERIDVSMTVLKPNQTFGFGYVEFTEDFALFAQRALTEIARVEASDNLMPSRGTDNVIHFSALPWIQFTSLSHARPFSRPDSCPKISVGKLFQQDGDDFLPISIHVNHALADGYHVGLFFEGLEQRFNPLI